MFMTWLDLCDNDNWLFFLAVYGAVAAVAVNDSVVVAVVIQLNCILYSLHLLLAINNVIIMW